MMRPPGVNHGSQVAWRAALAGVGYVLTLATAIAGCSSGSGDNPIDPLANEYDTECGPSENQGDRCTKDCADTTGCGYNALGTKYCTCEGGVYTQCVCRPPADWKGTATAPYCDALTALPRYMEGQFCPFLEQECLSEPPTDGSEQMGCRCEQGANAKGWSCKTKSELGLSDAAESCLLTVTRGISDFLHKKSCDTDYQLCIARDYFDSSSPKGCACLHDGTAPLAWNCQGTNRWFRAE